MKTALIETSSAKYIRRMVREINKMKRAGRGVFITKPSWSSSPYTFRRVRWVVGNVRRGVIEAEIGELGESRGLPLYWEGHVDCSPQDFRDDHGNEICASREA